MNYNVGLKVDWEMGPLLIEAVLTHSTYWNLRNPGPWNGRVEKGWDFI